MRGLADERFDVRFQCARSLAAIVKANPELRIDAEAIFAVAQRELGRNRASSSLSHLGTILSLVLPAEPLRIAFRGLRAGDPAIRGTALGVPRRRAAAGDSRTIVAELIGGPPPTS